MIDTMISVYDVLDWYLITAIVVFAIGVLYSVRGGWYAYRARAIEVRDAAS